MISVCWHVPLWSPLLMSMLTKTELPSQVYNLKLLSHRQIPFWGSHGLFKVTHIESISAWLQQCSGETNLTVQRVQSFLGLLRAPPKSISALCKTREIWRAFAFSYLELHKWLIKMLGMQQKTKLFEMSLCTLVPLAKHYQYLGESGCWEPNGQAHGLKNWSCFVWN